MSFTIKTESEIINDILVNIVQNVDAISDINVGSVMRQMVESLSEEISNLYTELQDVYDGTRVLTATGDDLDDLGLLVGITRNAGTNAVGDVTFIRQTTSGSDFTVPSGTIVSTDPALGGQKRFVVTTTTTFDSDITENTDFVDGIYNYALTERLIGTIVTLDGTAAAAPFSFVEDVDFENEFLDGVHIPDVATLVEVDTCEATAGWTVSADATVLALNAVENIQGTNALDLGKSGGASTAAFYFKTLAAPINLTDKRFFIWLDINDQATLDKLSSTTIRLSSDSAPTNNYYEFSLGTLLLGMNLYSVDIDDANNTQVGFPNTDTINSIRIDLNTNNAADTFVSGKVVMDYWHSSVSDNPYYGDTIHWLITGTLPDDATIFTTNWKPLSVDVPVESEDVGEDFNVAANRIIYKVSFVSNINSVNNYLIMSSGTDIESDADLRERIQNAAAAAGKATVEAIRQSILAVNGVQSVTVTDLPILDIYGPSGGVRTQEAHVMNISVTTNKLDYEVAVLDNVSAPTNIIIADAFDDNIADWTYGSGNDYILNTDTNEIEWQDVSTPGVTSPADGAFYYVGYQAEWLGHVQVYVAGFASPLSSSIQTLVDTAITDSKAAGIQVTWAEPTIQFINITSTVTVDTASGFNATTVKTNVQTAIIAWLNDKDIGDDVLIAEFYEIVMAVDGVLNVAITDWDGDVAPPFADITIDTDEVARPEDSGIVVN